MVAASGYRHRKNAMTAALDINAYSTKALKAGIMNREEPIA
jgi:hypothetical protein